MYHLRFWKISLLKIGKLLPAFFSRNFCLRSIYPELLIIGLIIYIIPNVRSVKFGLCSILIFFSFFLLFLSVFFLTDTNNSQITGKGEEFLNFLLFHFHQLTNSSSRFLPLLFNRSICSYQTDSWWNLFSFEISILVAFLLMQLSCSYWLWHFKVTSWWFELVSNYHPSFTKRTP